MPIANLPSAGDFFGRPLAGCALALMMATLPPSATGQEGTLDASWLRDAPNRADRAPRAHGKAAWIDFSPFGTSGSDFVSGRDELASPALLAAIKSGDAAAVRGQLEHPIALNLPDAAGDTGLNIAVRAGHIDVVRLLLERGADPNRRGADGMSPLMRATLADDRWMARLLLRQGADPDQPDASGQRPLFAAIKFRRDAITVEILQADADIEIENSEHMSALVYSIVEGDMPALQLMLKRGARINREDEDGRTPLFWALFFKRYDQARLLFSAGGRLGQQNIALPADWPSNAGNGLPDDGRRTAIGRVDPGWRQ